MPLREQFQNQRFATAFASAPGSERVFSFPFLVAAAILLVTGGPIAMLSCPEASAQDQPTAPPSVDREEVLVHRGRDVVQVPSLWYQEGESPPDSLGTIRVPRGPESPGAVTHREARRQFPVHLQMATFVRDAQVAEIPISASVIRGDVRGRIIIKPPREDGYDIAVPLGLDPIERVPGEKTVIDAREWYEASLHNKAGGQASDDRFHTTRQLRGTLQSTAPGGETVQFALLARPAGTPAPKTPRATPPIPPVKDHFIVSEVQVETNARTEPVQTETAPRLPFDLTTTVASLAGPSRANIPGRFGAYSARRIKGDIASTLRWRVSRRKSYALSFHGSTQATLGTGGHRNHHAVPYGVGVAARFGTRQAIYIRGEAAYRDDPFQAQTLSTGDQRLRLLVGMDYRSESPPAPKTQWRLSAGPTYFLDRPSSWEQSRPDARELGASLKGRFRHRFTVEPVTATVGASVDVKKSWGYIGSAGNANTTVSGRLSIKPTFQLSRAQLQIGPVGYFQFIDNEYAAAPGFTEQNLQFGLEATTRLFF